MCLDIGLIPGCGDLSALHSVPAVHVLAPRHVSSGPPGQQQSDASAQGIAQEWGGFWTHPYRPDSVSPLQEEV